MYLYSTTLLASMIVAVPAVIVALLPRRLLPRWGMATGMLLGVASLALVCVSFSVHITAGHGAASPEPMDLPRFLGEHRAYLVVAPADLLAIVLPAVRTMMGTRATASG